MVNDDHLPHKGAAVESEPFIEGRMKADDLDGPPPNDHFRMVYCIILLHGIGFHMPWNMFISVASQYLDYKLVPFNGHMQEYVVNFFSYLGVFSQLPYLLLNLINLFIVVKGSLGPRIVISLLLVGAYDIFNFLFIFIETRTWTLGFFIMTVASVVVLNSANGIYQSSIYGLVADFPAHFTNAVLLGNNVCGIFVTILYIIKCMAFN
uniref:Equilibrative nucleoside transporter 3 n=1 Tax=Acrobeloides nanus TaxID=290746 RepID=A0A914EIV4_9BILA